MPTALVSGATGFIGGALVERLAAERWRVRALVRRATDATALAVLGVEVVRGDLTDPSSLGPACSGVDVLFHCAALVTDWAPRRAFRAVNVDGAGALAEAAAAAHVGRFVHVSTTDVYGFPDANDTDEDAPHRRRGWGYPDSKIDGERVVREVAERARMPLTIVRPGTVFGPRGKDFVEGVGDLLLTRRLPLVNRGRAFGGFAYGPNLARGLMLAATAPGAAGRAYNLHDGTEATWAEYFVALAAGIGAPPPTRSIPRPVATAAAAAMEALWRAARRRTRPLLTRHAVAVVGTDQEFRTERARAELGYRPEVPFGEAVRLSATWYLDRRGTAAGRGPVPDKGV